MQACSPCLTAHDEDASAAHASAEDAHAVAVSLIRLYCVAVSLIRLYSAPASSARSAATSTMAESNIHEVALDSAQYVPMFLQNEDDAYLPAFSLHQRRAERRRRQAKATSTNAARLP
jgi:hypothetical protein